MPKANTAFTIQVPISKKLLNYLIDNSLQDLTESFAYGDKGVRNKDEVLRKALSTDQVFIDFVTKKMTKVALEAIDCEADDFDYSKHPAIQALIEEVEPIEDQYHEEYSKELDQKVIAAAMRELKQRGYTVSKN